jgi:hypothetical protein
MEDNQVPLYIVITCDTVSDYFDSSLWTGKGEAPLQWRGIEEGIAAMVGSCDALLDCKEASPRFTWFVPVDNYMETQYGASTYLLDRFSDVWEMCAARGGEIAWHVYQHQVGGGQWHPEHDYDVWHEGLMRCRDDCERLGFRPQSTRIGGTHCSNRIMRTLEEMGIKCDMTALPGRVRNEGFLQLDWAPTTQAPYYPSVEDYRVPGTSARSVLEIPLTMVPVEAAYDSEPFQRYVDFSFYHRALAPGLKAHLHKGPSYLSVIVHPSAVLSGVVEKEHGLLSFSIEEFAKNLHFVVDHCLASERPVEFVTVAELAEIVKASGAAL